MARPTDEQAGLILARRTEALRLRAEGLPLLDIARRLHASNGVPMGYTPDPDQVPKQCTAAVARDLGAAIRHEYKENRDAARALAGDLLGRLQVMWEAVEDRIAEGDLRAIDVGIRIVERTARMTGVESSPLDRLGPDGEARVSAAFVLLTQAVEQAAGDGAEA